MPNNLALAKEQLWSRRQLLKLGLGGTCVAGAAALWHATSVNSQSIVKVPPLEIAASEGVTQPMKMLRNFD